MSTLSFATSVEAACKGAEVVHFLAPQRHLRAGWLANVAPEAALRLLARAAAEEEAGAQHKTVHAENPDGGAKRYVLTILPDERSRHNAPGRPEECHAGFAAADLPKAGTSAVIACLDDAAHAVAVARALGRTMPLYQRTTPGPKAKGAARAKAAPRTTRFLATDADGLVLKMGTLERQVVEHARIAAELVDMPPSELHTPQFVQRVKALARGVPNLTVKVWSGDEVLERGLGGLHAVGRTAIHPPKVLFLTYKPARPRRHVALVGKGVVYDTGGLSLKPTTGMFGMKCDMGGAAAVAGATLALARAKTPDAIHAVIGLVENAIGPDAYRPDDILVMHSGKTVEINNTDAEGRLVLADAASAIARQQKLDLLVDMATLTGAQVVATGQRHAAVVSNRAGVEAAAVAAGRASGDLTHPLPFAPEFYQANFQSQVADMRNSVNDRMDAQSSCAAQFVFSHIADLDIPWLHVDLAGPAYRKDRGTGYGVALVAELLRSLTKDDLAA